MKKYEYIIELGKSLPLIDEQFKTEDNLIKGCQSRVWLHAQYKDGKIYYTADSDAIMTKGIVALLIRAFSEQTASNCRGRYRIHQPNWVKRSTFPNKSQWSSIHGKANEIICTSASITKIITMKTDSELQARRKNSRKNLSNI